MLAFIGLVEVPQRSISSWPSDYDLQESREIGAFLGTTVFLEEKTGLCSVQEKECKIEAEWRALIKPFMED